MSPNDFVFIDEGDVPWRVRKIDDGFWLCRWHPDKRWVTARPAYASEASLWFGCAVSDDMAKLYEAGVPFLPCPP